MKISLSMPQFGESITQGRIVKWLKTEGHSVNEAEPLVEMETEKTVFAYESPFRGKLSKMTAQNDAEVSVGSEIAQFEVSEEDGKKYLSLGIGRAIESAAGTPKQEGLKAEKGIAPLIRSLAKEGGIPLEEVSKIQGTGPAGRITKEDFLKFANNKVPVPTAPAPLQEGVKMVPVSAIRARIADNMTLSARTIPHAGTGLDVDLFTIEKWRMGQKEKFNYLSFVVWAAVQTLKEFPLIHSVWKEAGGKRWIEAHDDVNLGLAVAAEQGLIVPVISKADRLSFRDLSKEMERVAEGGRKGTLKPQEMTGGTFTVNNTGALGAIRSLQVIPPNQSAILAVNRAVKRPWAVGESVSIRPIIGLDLAFDHRLIDGDQAIGFLVKVKDKLEHFDFSVVG